MPSKRPWTDLRRTCWNLRALFAHPDCSWRDAVVGLKRRKQGTAISHKILSESRKKKTDPEGYELWDTGETGDWWTPSGGLEVLAHVLGERATGQYVAANKGDLVLDCGAHVGTFSRAALQNGAEKVIAVEPDPLKLECLRRNLSDYISAGRAVLYPKGVWDKTSVLTFYYVSGNCGADSFISVSTAANQVQLPVTTVDELVHDLNLPRVDYIKMDVEGAERAALRGCRQVISDHRPSMTIALEHRYDDRFRIPALIRELSSHPYSVLCPGWPSALHFRPAPDGRLSTSPLRLNNSRSPT